jgi:hypothetical protein
MAAQMRVEELRDEICRYKVQIQQMLEGRREVWMTRNGWSVWYERPKAWQRMVTVSEWVSTMSCFNNMWEPDLQRRRKLMLRVRKKLSVFLGLA